LARFVRPSDVICAWGCHSFDLWRGSGGAPTQTLVDLRAEAHRLFNRKLGSVEGYAAALGPPLAPLGQGRAGRRLAASVQIVRAWRAAPPTVAAFSACLPT